MAVEKQLRGFESFFRLATSRICNCSLLYLFYIRVFILTLIAFKPAIGRHGFGLIYRYTMILLQFSSLTQITLCSNILTE